MIRIVLWLTLSLLATHLVRAQAPAPVPNYDEANVGTYVLPNPLVNRHGKRVKTKADWIARRNELRQLFAENVYGQTPKQPLKLRFQTTSVDSSALGGLAIRKLVSIVFVDYPKLPSIDVLLYLPKHQQRAPVFLGLNFCGNHCVTTEVAIPLSTRWMANVGEASINNKATEKARGLQERRWPVATILKRGYALATAYYGDIEPDYPLGRQAHIRSILGASTALADRPGDTTKANNWGAIGAWAWGMSRILDYLQTEQTVDARRVIAFGHSRIAKAALWAGAQDDRFAAVIANESGEGGAALSRRWYGETVERLNTTFPHWFCPRYAIYNNRVADLPVDQHELLALIAPRPLYIASADGDQWSDPKGEFLGAVNAEPVYQLYGKTGLGTSTFPSLNQPVGHTVRYHDRTGKHDVTDYDWEQYLRFADELVQ